jgi:hypothetical protein
VYGRMWEWVVDQGADNAPSGVCGAQHRAMEALSRTLVAANRPASGHVTSIALVDGAFEFSYYRLPAALWADFEKGVIRWQRLTA